MPSLSLKVPFFAHVFVMTIFRLLMISP